MSSPCQFSWLYCGELNQMIIRFCLFQTQILCQERSWLGDGYVQRLGFLGLAEENNIVMMFPQVSFVHHKGAGNNSLFDQKYVSLDSTLSCARESKWMLVGEISKKV